MILSYSQIRRVKVSSRVLQALATALLGLVILLAVGFAPVDALHSVAHDARHSAAFPCH